MPFMESRERFKVTSGSLKSARAGKRGGLGVRINCRLHKASSRVMSATSPRISTTGSRSKNSTGDEPITPTFDLGLLPARFRGIVANSEAIRKRGSAKSQRFRAGLTCVAPMALGILPGKVGRPTLKNGRWGTRLQGGRPAGGLPFVLEFR